jgi:hypothetical protein
VPLSKISGASEARTARVGLVLPQLSSPDDEPRDTAEALKGKELKFLQKRVNSWQRTFQYISAGHTQPIFVN